MKKNPEKREYDLCELYTAGGQKRIVVTSDRPCTLRIRLDVLKTLEPEVTLKRIHAGRPVTCRPGEPRELMWIPDNQKYIVLGDKK